MTVSSVIKNNMHQVTDWNTPKIRLNALVNQIKKSMSNLLEDIKSDNSDIKSDNSDILSHLDLDKLNAGFIDIKKDIEQLSPQNISLEDIDQLKYKLEAKIKNLKESISDNKKSYNDTLLKVKNGIKDLKQKINKEIRYLDSQPSIKKIVIKELDKVLISLKNKDLNYGSIYKISKAKNDLEINIHLLQYAIKQANDSLNIEEVIKPINTDVLIKEDNKRLTDFIDAVGDLNNKLNNINSGFNLVTKQLESKMVAPSKDIKDKFVQFHSSLSYVNYQVAQLNSSDYNNLLSTEDIYNIGNNLADSLDLLSSKVNLIESSNVNNINPELLTKKVYNKISDLFDAIAGIQDNLSEEQKSNFMSISVKIYNLPLELNTNDLSIFLEKFNEILSDVDIKRLFNATNNATNLTNTVETLLLNLDSLIKTMDNHASINEEPINIDSIKNNVKNEFIKLSSLLENLELNLHNIIKNIKLSLNTTEKPSKVVEKTLESKELESKELESKELESKELERLKDKQKLFLAKPVDLSLKILDNLEIILNNIKLGDFKTESYYFNDLTDNKEGNSNNILDELDEHFNLELSDDDDGLVGKGVKNLFYYDPNEESYQPLNRRNNYVINLGDNERNFANELKELEQKVKTVGTQSSVDSGISDDDEFDIISQNTEKSLSSIGVDFEDVIKYVAKINTDPNASENKKLRAKVIDIMKENGFFEEVKKYIETHTNKNWAKNRLVHIFSLCKNFLNDTTDLKDSNFKNIFTHTNKNKGFSLNKLILDKIKDVESLEFNTGIKMNKLVLDSLKDLRQGRFFNSVAQNTTVWTDLIKPAFTRAFEQLENEESKNKVFN